MPWKSPCAAPTFDDRQAAPLDLLPAAAHQPGVDLLQQLCQVVWVRLHDLVELSELQRGDTGNIRLWASQRFPDLGAIRTFPGRKNTLVNPNLKSLLFSPRALNSNYRGSNTDTVNHFKKEASWFQDGAACAVAVPCRRVSDWGASACQACTVCTCCRAHGRELWRGSPPASGPTPTPCLSKDTHKAHHWPIHPPDITLSSLPQTLASNLIQLYAASDFYVKLCEEIVKTDCRIRYSVFVPPEHCSCDRIRAPSNWWLIIFRLGLTHRMKLEPWEDRILISDQPLCNVCNHWYILYYSLYSEAFPAAGSAASVWRRRRRRPVFQKMWPEEMGTLDLKGRAEVHLKLWSNIKAVFRRSTRATFHRNRRKL